MTFTNKNNQHRAINSNILLTPEIMNISGITSVDKIYLAFLLANDAESGLDITMQEIADILRITYSAAGKCNTRLLDKGFISNTSRGNKRRRITLHTWLVL